MGHSSGKIVYVTLVKNGKKVTEAMSYDEAMDAGIFDPQAYALLNDDEHSVHFQSKGLVCPVDGYTQKDFERTGRLGCPHCYETFSSLIDPMLTKIHKDTRHKGKAPGNRKNRQQLNNRLLDLRQELTNAVTNERYEDAAAVRDKIKTIEIELKSDD